MPPPADFHLIFGPAGDLTFDYNTTNIQEGPRRGPGARPLGAVPLPCPAERGAWHGRGCVAARGAPHARLSGGRRAAPPCVSRRALARAGGLRLGSGDDSGSGGSGAPGSGSGSWPGSGAATALLRLCMHMYACVSCEHRGKTVQTKKHDCHRPWGSLAAPLSHSRGTPLSLYTTVALRRLQLC